MSRVGRFARFWVDFVVGDDPWIAAGVVAALGLAAALDAIGIDPWWLLPPAVAVVLASSLGRAARRG